MAVKIKVVKSNVDRVAQSLASKTVVAGLPKDSARYPSGGESVIDVAAKHEYGDPKPQTYTSPRGNTVTVSGIPERSFMRSTNTDKQGEWKAFVINRVKAAVAGKTNTETILNQVGSRMETAIKDKINSIQSPPNSPQVIADKGSSNPLIDTGHMVNAIKYEIRDVSK